MLTRHLVAILALPFVGVVVVPALLVAGLLGPDTHWPFGGPLLALPWAAGVPLWLAGFALWAWCVWLLARVGRGTLAPWHPTRHLVVAGPYRHVRNPMIAGVVAMLLGESLCLGSLWTLAWALSFALGKHLWFRTSEEPALVRRFGEPYRHYRAAVPRWLPRRGAWDGGDGSATNRDAEREGQVSRPGRKSRGAIAARFQGAEVGDARTK